MSDYYDRDGRPLDMMTWARLLADEDHKRVADTTLDDGTWISTIWLGLDHNYAQEGPPLIFETMVFPRHGPSVSMAEMQADPHAADHWREQECWRYPTEAAALAGHDQICAKITEALERLRDAVDGLDIGDVMGGSDGE